MTIIQFQIILIIVTLLAGVGMGAAELGYVTDPFVKRIILAILIASLIGDAILAIKRLLEQRASVADKASASDVIKKALDLACIAMSSDGVHNFRANVFSISKEKKNEICIKYHSTNMDEAADQKIRFAKWQGCVGYAWGYRAPTVADMTLPFMDGGPRWGLTAEQLELTNHLKAILALPVRLPKDHESIIAILSFDTEEPIAELLIKDHHKKIASEVASQIGLLLAAFNNLTDSLD